FLFFRLQLLAGPTRSARPRVAERPVMVPSGTRKAEQADTPVPRPRRRMEQEQDFITVETDRLLDKISRQGIASLTPAERKFLDEVSKRKRH
ncbi:MAG TPA: hypothetical protein PLI70_10435, partial [Gemmatimonadales bacterium]|nr:hypothetical protein [Gemmatimonadales bacterium]